jgi:hypothetical protein
MSVVCGVAVCAYTGAVLTHSETMTADTWRIIFDLLERNDRGATITFL